MKRGTSTANTILSISGLIIILLTIYNIVALTFIVLSKTLTVTLSPAYFVTLATTLLTLILISTGFFIIGNLKKIKFLKIYPILFSLGHFVLVLLIYFFLSQPENIAIGLMYSFMWPISGILSITLGIKLLKIKKQSIRLILALSTLLILDGIYLVIGIGNNITILLEAFLSSLIPVLIGAFFIKTSKEKSR